MTARLYLDYNATAPLAPEVRDAMLPWLDGVATNPSAVHREGQNARAAVEDARAVVAEFCGGGDVIFTSGGTEADNLAISGVLGWPPAGHVVVSAVEHPAVLEPIAALAALGVDVSVADVDAEGRVSVEALRAALRPETRLVSLMAANNETGTLQPVAAVAESLRGSNVPLHCDAVQAAAWQELPEMLGDTSLVSLSGHKIGGPPGVGALVLRKPQSVQPLLHGGGQQRGRRPGTEPTALLVGLAAACRRVVGRRNAEAARIGQLTRELADRLQSRVDGLRLTVPTAARLPNTLHLCLTGCPADLLVARADLEGIALSAGSACASGVAHGSYVLAALGVPPEYRDGAVRISLGYETTAAGVERAASQLPIAIAAVRAASS
jgi:cysteine desulfurase